MRSILVSIMISCFLVQQGIPAGYAQNPAQTPTPPADSNKAAQEPTKPAEPVQPPADVTTPANPSADTAKAAEPAPTGDVAKAPLTVAMLKEGSEVVLNLDQDLSSKTAVTGDPVQFVLAKDVKVGDVVVVKAGAIAVGEVSNAKKAGMMGKPGELNIRLDYLKAGDTKVHLRGTEGREGNSGTAGVVALTVAFGVVGFLHHGKQVKIPKGTELKAYVSDDISLPPTM